MIDLRCSLEAPLRASSLVIQNRLVADSIVMDDPSSSSDRFNIVVDSAIVLDFK